MLTCARWSIQDDTFGGLNSHFFIILWMCERQLHWLLYKRIKNSVSYRLKTTYITSHLRYHFEWLLVWFWSVFNEGLIAWLYTLHPKHVLNDTSTNKSHSPKKMISITHIPWSPGSDCPVLQCQRRSLVEPSPPSSLSPRDQCHPSALQSQHEPTHDAHLGRIWQPFREEVAESFFTAFRGIVGHTLKKKITSQ